MVYQTFLKLVIYKVTIEYLYVGYLEQIEIATIFDTVLSAYVTVVPIVHFSES